MKYWSWDEISVPEKKSIESCGFTVQCACGLREGGRGELEIKECKVDVSISINITPWRMPISRHKLCCFPVSPANVAVYAPVFSCRVAFSVKWICCAFCNDWLTRWIKRFLLNSTWYLPMQKILSYVWVVFRIAFSSLGPMASSTKPWMASLSTYCDFVPSIMVLPCYWVLKDFS